MAILESHDASLVVVRFTSKRGVLELAQRRF
jgi:hypothetical protein